MNNMFISNINKISDTKKYKCGSTMGNFLISEGFPLLGREGKLMVFSKTKRLEKVLAHLPLNLKVLRKVGFIHG